MDWAGRKLAALDLASGGSFSSSVPFIPVTNNGLLLPCLNPACFASASMVRLDLPDVSRLILGVG